MRQLFSTDKIPARNKYSACDDFFAQTFPGARARPIDAQSSFNANFHIGSIGQHNFLEVTSTGLRIQPDNPSSLKGASDFLHLTFILKGDSYVSQNDQSTKHSAGSFYVMASSTPFVHEGRENNLTRIFTIERSRLERYLGPARIYAGLQIPAFQPTASLASVFFGELARVQSSLDAHVGDAMMDTGLSIITAAIADRMAIDYPKSLLHVITMQRAKAYIESHLGDMTLNPGHLAAAMGVSLRHMHQLFRENGQTISDWIWQRRLDRAVMLLSNPAHLRLSVDAIAATCGFKDQGHFSRRFKARFGASPREYRQLTITRLTPDGR